MKMPSLSFEDITHQRIRMRFPRRPLHLFKRMTPYLLAERESSSEC